MINRRIFCKSGPWPVVFLCVVSGWWLSLSRHDDFLHRQGFVSEQSRLFDDLTRFAKFNAKTLGFVLVSNARHRPAYNTIDR